MDVWIFKYTMRLLNDIYLNGKLLDPQKEEIYKIRWKIKESMDFFPDLSIHFNSYSKYLDYVEAEDYTDIKKWADNFQRNMKM